MLTKIKLVLAAVLVLGAGSLAQASNGRKRNRWVCASAQHGRS